MHRYLPWALMILLPTNLLAEPTDDSRDSSDQLIAAFDKDIAELTVAYEKKVAELNAAYSARVTTLKGRLVAKLATLQKSVAADDLDEALRIRDQAKEIEKRSILPARTSDKGRTRENVGKSDDVGKLRAEIAKQASKIIAFEKRLQSQSPLAKELTGVSYRITFGGTRRVWTFGPNGLLLSNGKSTATRWAAFGKAGVVCIGANDGNVDLCQFSDDGSKIEVIYVGDFKKSRTHHSGVLLK